MQQLHSVQPWHARSAQHGYEHKDPSFQCLPWYSRRPSSHAFLRHCLAKPHEGAATANRNAHLRLCVPIRPSLRTHHRQQSMGNINSVNALIWQDRWLVNLQTLVSREQSVSPQTDQWHRPALSTTMTGLLKPSGPRSAAEAPGLLPCCSFWLVKSLREHNPATAGAPNRVTIMTKLLYPADKYSRHSDDN